MNACLKILDTEGGHAVGCVARYLGRMTTVMECGSGQRS